MYIQKCSRYVKSYSKIHISILNEEYMLCVTKNKKKVVNDLANQKNITMILRPSMEISPQFHALYKALEIAYEQENMFRSRTNLHYFVKTIAIDR